MGLESTLSVTVYDAVTFSYEVTNAGSEPVELTFRSGKQADVVVLDGEQEVWRWSDGRMFTQAIREYTMEPGETITQEFTWDEPEPGEYEARAMLATETAAEATTTFNI